MAEESAYKRRVAKGLCGSCGKEPIAAGSKSLGTTCLAKFKDRATTKRTKNREKGCVDCGAPVESGTRCEKHKALQRQSRQKSVDRRKEEGVCVNGASHGAAKEGCVLCQACIDKLSATSSEHYQRRKAAGTCYYCHQPPESGKTTCPHHSTLLRQARFKLKVEALNAYGGPQCSWPGCACCDPEVLQLDHVDGGGSTHFRKIGVDGGNAFYQWLKNHGYPRAPKLRVLCPTHNIQAYAESRKLKGADDAG